MALISAAVGFVFICIITAFCGYIKGRMKKLNQQIEKANHYEHKLTAAIRKLQKNKNDFDSIDKFEA